MILLTSGQPVRYPLMMKRIAIATFLFPALLLLGACGKYGSMAEARSACGKWMVEGGLPQQLPPRVSKKEWFAKNPGASQMEWLVFEEEQHNSRNTAWDNALNATGGIRRCTNEQETNQILGYDKKGKIAKRFKY